MNQIASNPSRNSRKGCLFAIVCVIGLFVLTGFLIKKERERLKQEFERRESEIRSDALELVKAGDDGSGVYILDSLAIEMLANDPECASNLRILALEYMEIEKQLVSAAGNFKHVETIYFNSCVGTEYLLEAMKGSTVVGKITFETTRLNDNSIEMLTTFPNLKHVVLEYVVEDSMPPLLKEKLPGVQIDIPYLKSEELTD
jgi:hypothetical protein